MKCLIISDFAERRGGASVVAIDEAVALQHSGVETFFLFGLGSVDPALRESGVTVLRGPALQAVDRLGLLFGVNPGIARFIESDAGAAIRGCAVAHVHGTTRYFGFRFLWAIKRLGLRIVWTVHDYVVWCPVGTYYNHQQHRPCTLRPLSAACVTCHCDRASYAHKLVRVARHLAIRRSAGDGAVDRFVFVSPVARRAAERLAGRALAGDVVWNPVSALPVSKSWPSDARELSARRFVFVGRLCPEKGLATLVRVACRVDAEFLLIGDGMIPVGVSENVRSLPHVAAAQLSEALCGATALLLLSEWAETFGLVVAEAASVGVPSVVSRQCGVSELLPSDAGWVVDPEDEPGLVDLLQRLAGSEEARVAGARARRWFIECQEMKAQTHAREIRRVYQSVGAG